MFKFSYYHLYISIEGDKALFKSLFEFLESVSAKKLYDYPIWSFRSEENQEVYVNKLIKIFKDLQKTIPTDSSVVAKWQILLMGPHGHNGFSGGGPFAE